MSMDAQRQKSLKVLVIGDTCDDVYHFGTCTRINPEAPAPLLTFSRSEMRPGMATNVALNVSSLGHDVKLVTNVMRPKKERFLDERYSYQLLRVDTNVVIPRVSADQLNEMCSYECAAVVISDYDKGFLTHDDISTIIEMKGSIPIFIDTKKTHLVAFDKPNVVFKINELERMALGSTELTFASSIVTLGSRGAEFHGELFDACKSNVYDVCGAGDTFLAALVSNYIVTRDFRSAITFANMCASIAIQHVGTYVIKQSDIAMCSL